MGRSATDPNGTAALAAQRGVSRRTIQRERARLLRTTEAAQAQAVPTQLSLTGIGPPAMEWPEELRVDPGQYAQPKRNRGRIHRSDE